MAGIKVGNSSIKKKKLEVNAAIDLAPKKVESAPINIDTGIDEKSIGDQLNEQLKVNKARAEQAGIANKAKEHDEKMTNRNWFEKMINYDPDANPFFNILSGLTFGFTWADNAFLSLAELAAGGFSEKAINNQKEKYDAILNKGESRGLSDTIATIGNQYGWTDAKNWHELAGDSTWAKIGGLGLDIFGSPSTLALSLIPGVGEAKLASKIMEGVNKFSKLTSSVNKVEKVADTVKKGSQVAEGLNTLGKAAKGAKVGEKVAEGINDFNKFYGALDGTTNTAKNVLKSIKRTGKLPNSLKDNKVWQSIANYGAKTNYSKKWEKAATLVNKIHTTSINGAKGINAAKNVQELTQTFNKFRKGTYSLEEVVRKGGLLKNSAKWVGRNTVGRIPGLENAKLLQPGTKLKNINLASGAKWNNVKQASKWALMPGFKAIGTGLQGVSKALGKYARSGAVGSQTINKFQKGWDNTKTAFANKFVKNKGLSQESINAIDRVEGAKNVLQKNNFDLSEMQGSINHIGTKYSDFKANKLAPKDLDILKNTKFQGTNYSMYDVMDQIKNNKKLSKEIDKNHNFLKDLFSGDKEALGKYLDNGFETTTTKSGTTKFKDSKIDANDFKGQLIKHLDEQDKLKIKADYDSKVNKLMEEQKLSKAKAQKLVGKPDFSNYFSANDWKNKTIREKNLYLKNRLRSTDPTKVVEAQKYIDSLLETLDAEGWKKLNETTKDLIRTRLRPVQRLMENVGASEINDLGNFGKKYVRRYQDGLYDNIHKSEFDSIKDIFNVVKDPTKFREEIIHNTLKKTANFAGVNAYEDLMKLKKNSPRLYEKELNNMLDQLHAAPVENVISQYFADRVNSTRGNKSFVTKLAAKQDDPIHLLHNQGKLELADASQFRSYQDKYVNDTVNNIVGENLKRKEAFKQVENWNKAQQRVDKLTPEISAKLAENGIIAGSDNYVVEFNAMLEKQDPKLYESIKQKMLYDSEMERLAKIGDKYTQEFSDRLVKHWIEPEIASRVEEHSSKLREKAIEYVNKQNDNAIKGLEANITKLEKELKNAKKPETIAKRQEKLKQKQQQLDHLKSEINDKKLVEQDIENLVQKGWQKNVGSEEFKQQLQGEYFKSRPQTNKSLGRLSAYNPAGRYFELTDQGKELFDGAYRKVFNPNIEDEVFPLLNNFKNLDSDELAQLKQLTGLTEKQLEFISGEQKFSSFAKLNDDMATQLGRLSTSTNIPSLEEASRYLKNRNNAIVRETANVMGITSETLNDAPLWFRSQLADDGSLKYAMEGIHIGDWKTSKLNIKGINEKILTKTLFTRGPDTNVFFGDKITNMSPIKEMQSKINMLAEGFGVENIMQNMLDTGDAFILSEALQNQYFSNAESLSWTRQKGYAKIDKSFAKVSNDLPAGHYIVKADEIAKKMDFLKSLDLENGYNKFIDKLVGHIKNNVSSERLAAETTQELLSRSYLVMPPQTWDAMVKVAELSNPASKVRDGIFTMAAKTFNRIYKQLAFLSPSYHIRNEMTSLMNFYLNGMPMGKSVVQKLKASKDLVRWNGFSIANKTVKKGLSQMIQEEKTLLTQMRRSLTKNSKAITNETAIQSLLKSNKISAKDAEFAKEMIMLHDNRLLGGINIRADFAKLLDTNRALAKDMTKTYINKYGYSKNLFKKIYDKSIGIVTDANMKLGAWADDAARLAAYRMLNDDSALLAKLGHTDAISGSKFINLDYTNMTKFEKEKVRIFVPFYSYFRQAFAMHFKNFTKNTYKYAKIEQAMKKANDDYTYGVDKNGLPSWIGNMSYIPFGNDQKVHVFKPSLAYQAIKDAINLTIGGVQSVAGSDSISSRANTQSALNFIGQFNPLIKAGISTATGSNFYGEQTEGSWVKALWNEYGGVITRIPDMVKKAMEDGEGAQEIEDTILNLLGIANTYETDSLKQQRARELINYIEKEIEKSKNYVRSYSAVREELFGKEPKRLNIGRSKYVPQAVRMKKRKTKKNQLNI